MSDQPPLPPPPLYQPPLAYESPQLFSRDVEHLRLLAIFHYIAGGIIMVFSSCGILYFGLGLTMLMRPATFAGRPGSPPPTAAGYIFAIVGGLFVFGGWGIGGLTIYSGRCIARRRLRLFSLIVAGFCCLWFPFGTILGVFTFLVLLRPSAAALYPTTMTAQ